MFLADRNLYKGKGLARTFESRTRISIYVFT